MHVSMSHWEAPEITDNMYETMQKRFMPMIKSLGATPSTSHWLMVA